MGDASGEGTDGLHLLSLQVLLLEGLLLGQIARDVHDVQDVSPAVE